MCMSIWGLNVYVYFWFKEHGEKEKKKENHKSSEPKRVTVLRGGGKQINS